MPLSYSYDPRVGAPCALAPSMARALCGNPALARTKHEILEYLRAHVSRSTHLPILHVDVRPEQLAAAYSEQLRCFTITCREWEANRDALMTQVRLFAGDSSLVAVDNLNRLDFATLIFC
jgi:hypothetical protein